MAAPLSMQVPPQIRRGIVPLPPLQAVLILDERSDAMPFIPLSLIGAGLLGNLLLVLLLLGDATAPGRMPLVVAAALALGGGAMMLAGLLMLEPRRRREADHRS
jgi:hypothetical protein